MSPLLKGILIKQKHKITTKQIKIMVNPLDEYMIPLTFLENLESTFTDKDIVLKFHSGNKWLKIENQVKVSYVI